MQAKFKLFLAVRERFTRETKPYYKFAKFVPKIGNFFFFFFIRESFTPQQYLQIGFFFYGFYFSRTIFLFIF